MASTSSSSSSSATTHYEYDVFLSFRGEDTRNSFTDHLYQALRRAGIKTFRDDNEIREGRELKQKIERSITRSRASIIVFSKDFAGSRWCLDELWLILEQKRKGSHFVLPVFYGVDPSDIRNQRGSFKVEAKEGSKWTENNVKRWKAALTEVADLKGIVVSGYQSTLIQSIVKMVNDELGLTNRSTSMTDLIGIETRAEGICSWLGKQQPDSPVLAICGMGGSGKTTLANHIYNSNKHNFDSSSLLVGIEKHRDGLLGVQSQLLRDISGNSNMIISDVYEGALQLERAIHMNKALIVVDDVDDKDTLSTLFGPKVFPTDSKIIITTRHLDIDKWFGSISCGCLVHKSELLNDDESLGLLSYHAFGSQIPMEGFEELAMKRAQYCGGNPLALKVLGSSLPVSAQNQRARNNMIEAWRSEINSLNSFKGDLHSKIQVVLQRSYESLPYAHQKALFLHIACFFPDEFRYKVEEALENDYHAKSGIEVLVNRCLLYDPEDFNDELRMHKLLKDMAMKIVDEASKDPAERRIVWRHGEAYRLLSNGDGSKTIEGLQVINYEQEMKSKAFKTSSLVKLKNLKYLKLRHVKLTGSYKNFPDLRWLTWHCCCLKTIPPGLFTSSLVVLYMFNGDMEEFDPPTVLSSLKILNLSNSYKLVSIRNLYRLPKLETLMLHNCTSLTHVCKTMGDLKNLSILEFGGCTALYISRGSIPAQPLFSLPQSLSRLSLISNPCEMLPNYINFKMLRSLFLDGCSNLKSLTCLPSTLKELSVTWCTSLERITFQSSRFNLKVFSYEGCFKLCEVEGLFRLVSIAEVDEEDLGHMQWIKTYRDHKVNLIGDDMITRGRTFKIQMLYEYGIRSTYLQGIKDQSMRTRPGKNDPLS